MSISFNHPANTMTSTGSLNLNVTGGSTSAPQPIRLNATSMIVPVRSLPTGEAGSMLFDIGTRTLKYHNGTSWVDLQSADVILAPIYQRLSTIDQLISTKIDTVTYSSSAIPSASISGTNLNVVFPLASTSTSGPTGLFTSSRSGSIMGYSMISGQTLASIREQLSGISNGQNGRNGTQANPYITADGWALGDGLWWTWEGETGTVTKQVPNLNRGNYFKSINVATGGVTRTDNINTGSISISSTVLTIDQLPPHSFTFSGQTNIAGSHVHTFPLSNDRSGTGWADGASVGPNKHDGDQTTNAGGDHVHQFSGTTNTLGAGRGHSHTGSNIEVDRLELAYLYNIAEPTYALSQTVADGRYVKRTGDTMTGSLSVASGLILTGNDPNLAMFWRNSTNGERAAIYHTTTNNTLRLRSAGGGEVSIATSGALSTVSSLTAATSINGATLNITGAANTGVLNVTGQITATGDIWAFSDRRLKENIIPIANSLDIVDAIKGVKGNFIGEKNTRSMVIAQEVQKVLPEAVTVDESGYLKVSYDALIPVLLNAVSELREEVKKLRGEK